MLRRLIDERTVGQPFVPAVMRWLTQLAAHDAFAFKLDEAHLRVHELMMRGQSPTQIARAVAGAEPRQVRAVVKATPHVARLVAAARSTS